MKEQNDRNNRRTRMLIIMLFAIIAVLFAGIVYQFVIIKKLQKEQKAQGSAIVKVVENCNYISY